MEEEKMNSENNILLKVSNITKSYTEKKFWKKSVKNVLNDVSFSLKKGKCLGIIGESGSGKSTLGRILTGIENADNGIVEFEGKNIDFIYESIRREDNWHKKLEERLVYYRDFYNNFASGDSGFAVKPQLVLLCEDSKHMAETFKEIVMNKLEIPNINIYYTTDLLQNEESMQKTLSAFAEQDGKYKLIKLDAKLLA